MIIVVWLVISIDNQNRNDDEVFFRKNHVYSCGMSTTNSQLFMPLFIVSTVSAPGPLLRLDLQPLRVNQRDPTSNKSGWSATLFPTSKGDPCAGFAGFMALEIVNFQSPRLKKLWWVPAITPPNQKSTTKLAAF